MSDDVTLKALLARVRDRAILEGEMLCFSLNDLCDAIERVAAQAATRDDILEVERRLDFLTEQRVARTEYECHDDSIRALAKRLNAVVDEQARTEALAVATARQTKREGGHYRKTVYGEEPCECEVCHALAAVEAARGAGMTGQQKEVKSTDTQAPEAVAPSPAPSLPSREKFEERLRDYGNARAWCERDGDGCRCRVTYAALLAAYDALVARVAEWQRMFAAELDGATAMRERHGARDNETMDAFVARMARERDEAQRERKREWVAKEEARRLAEKPIGRREVWGWLEAQKRASAECSDFAAAHDFRAAAHRIEQMPGWSVTVLDAGARTATASTHEPGDPVVYVEMPPSSEPVVMHTPRYAPATVPGEPLIAVCDLVTQYVNEKVGSDTLLAEQVARMVAVARAAEDVTAEAERLGMVALLQGNLGRLRDAVRGGAR